MATIKAYLKFKADLRGFAEVRADEFRARVLPLRARREWDAAAAEYVQGLAAAGAGRALQQLYGLGHPAAAKVLGSAEIKADPLARAELDAEMRNLVDNCARAGWPRERFIAYGVYLDSQMAPRDLAASAQKAREAQDLAGAMWNKGARAAPDGKDVAPEGVDGLKDEFAEMYRGASLAFRRVVKDWLGRAADRAPEASLSAADEGELEAAGEEPPPAGGCLLAAADGPPSSAHACAPDASRVPGKAPRRAKKRLAKRAQKAAGNPGMEGGPHAASLPAELPAGGELRPPAAASDWGPPSAGGDWRAMLGQALAVGEAVQKEEDRSG